MRLKFLLHTCCAPCGIAAIYDLKDRFDLTVFFYNPNVFPYEEYLKRKDEVVRLCKESGVCIIDMDYDAGKWCDAISGFENDQEGGERCDLCIKFRLAKTAEFARDNAYHYFGTTLSAGRNKNAEVINKIGKNIADGNKVNFYDINWKKGGMQELSAKLVKEKNIYRQNYCGCKHSF